MKTKLELDMKSYFSQCRGGGGTAGGRRAGGEWAVSGRPAGAPRRRPAWRPRCRTRARRRAAPGPSGSGARGCSPSLPFRCTANTDRFSFIYYHLDIFTNFSLFKKVLNSIRNYIGLLHDYLNMLSN